MIGAHVDRVPFGNLAVGEGDHLAREPERGPGGKDVGAAREILLDQVVLRGAAELAACRPLALGRRYVKGEEPGCGRVDRHRGVHARERDAFEERHHVAEMRDRHAHLADLAPRKRVIAVVARLGRQVESDREPGLPAREIGAVELVRRLGRAVARIGADEPGLVARALTPRHWPASSPLVRCAGGSVAARNARRHIIAETLFQKK